MTAAPTVRPGRRGPLAVTTAAALPAREVLRRLEVTEDGLARTQVQQRLARYGPNAVSTHRAQLLLVLWHQVRSPLLGLLLAAAAASVFFGEGTDALIIGVIVAASVGLGFVNEYRAEKAAEALHSQIRDDTIVIRDGHPQTVEVTGLVPGDVVDLRLSDIVPADIRLLHVAGLECDESILTGESLPTAKDTDAAPAGAGLDDLSGCALMGTVVHAGTGRGVVVATGAQTQFGRIAAGLSTHQSETEFQVGLRRFSMLLVYVAAALTISIFAINVVLDKPILDALLFSLAIAVGITPQLLPAVVSTSLAAGSRKLAARKVLVKRLVCIEDLGNIEMLFTDKTGTLTHGRISFMRALPADSSAPDVPLTWGLLATDTTQAGGHVIGGNPLDAALWESPAATTAQAAIAEYQKLSVLAFDHERQMTSALVQDTHGIQTLAVKGAPETVLARCIDVPESARAVLAAEFEAGNRVIAVATKPAPGLQSVTAAAEKDLHYAGLLVFLDPPKPDAAQALARLHTLGITVKIVTGDNPVVAEKVCHDLGLPDGHTLTGAAIDALDDRQLAAAIADTSVFARVSPEHKARIVSVQRRTGGDVAVLGDGVNDALALHAADIGITVDSATDVAKDAADVILLEKDLDVLADGVAEGRRIFANTIKYVLMGTSSNFGNMFSAAGASLFLPFLPMLPSQILLNNLLYDTSQLTIPTDNVDEEQLRRPSHWDIRFIRRFMLYFGPFSSVFDFATFGIMLWVFHAGPDLFHTGWFVESIATQTLIIFVIRTRRTPFFRSHPSLPLTLAALGVVTVAAILPATPIAPTLGFQPLPTGYFAALVSMVIAYLILVEIGKHLFYRVTGPAAVTKPPTPQRHQRRRATRFHTRNTRRPGRMTQPLAPPGRL
ncbi:magnesium-translocating P-type ATPase [Rhodococcus opacus]|uniref:magnesium-translocating P-type ATPase n=1 Tax=Rhodococcus opacus TaxID=37919 RepID=UPI002235DE4F|nr:magnesium-translocating P-type ATPase [Rhodococcus opacus]UZG55240.1 magnesium-translocating P-type ATPase [Rhodococcus opacus]